MYYKIYFMEVHCRMDLRKVHCRMWSALVLFLNLSCGHTLVLCCWMCELCYHRLSYWREVSIIALSGYSF